MNTKTTILFEMAMESFKTDILGIVDSRSGNKIVPCEYGTRYFAKQVESYWRFAELLKPMGFEFDELPEVAQDEQVAMCDAPLAR